MKEVEEGSHEYQTLDNRQKAEKILANSFYGYLGYHGARWYSRECAEATTYMGRKYIQETIEKAEKRGFEVVYGDTDSIFLQGENLEDEIYPNVFEDYLKDGSVEVWGADENSFAGSLVFPEAPDHEDFVDVHLTVPRFFAWRIPRGEAGVEYGLAVAPGDDAPGRFEALLEDYGVELDRRCSGAIPIGPPERTVGERSLLVGDAAGQTKPFTGGGILYGMRAADVAAREVDPTRPETLAGYERAWREELRRDQRLGALVRAGYSMPEPLQRIGLRAFGRKDPVVEYKKEAFELFKSMMADIEEQVVSLVFKAGPMVEEEDEEGRQVIQAQARQSGAKAKLDPNRAKTEHESREGYGVDAEEQAREAQGDGQQSARERDPSANKQEPVVAGEKVGRNDPCPCGSGKKYKHCCGVSG
jgi:hypothetical protein